MFYLCFVIVNKELNELMTNTEALKAATGNRDYSTGMSGLRNLANPHCCRYWQVALLSRQSYVPEQGCCVRALPVSNLG